MAFIVYNRQTMTAGLVLDEFFLIALLKFAVLSTSYTTGWIHSKLLPVDEKWIYILQILAFKIIVICVVLFCPLKTISESLFLKKIVE